MEMGAKYTTGLVEIWVLEIWEKRRHAPVKKRAVKVAYGMEWNMIRVKILTSAK